MKVRYLGTLLLAALSLFGCDDNTGSLGMDMLPDTDGMSAHTTSFEVKTESFAADAVFAKTSTGYVGRFTDPDFGYYETSFLTELNCVDGFAFPTPYQVTEWDSNGNPTKATGTMAGDSVVSVLLSIYYTNWFGDSLNACRMSVYELDQKLDKNRYTNINPEEYYNKYDTKALLGRKAYSAYDTAVPDSVRNATNSSGSSTYSPNITFQLDKKAFEERLLKGYRENPDNFKNADSFIQNIFKGVYVKNDYGDGTILYVDQVNLSVQMRFHYLNDTTGVALKKKDGSDSLYYSYYNSEKGLPMTFASTKEVIQANRFANSDKIREKVNERNHTYLKSPAGIFTQATMPYDQIYEELSQDTLNAVKLTFTNYNQESKYDFSMSAPSNVLLIRKADLKSFFEENQVTDNVTSYTVAHNNVATNQYTFRNIARLVTACISEKQAAKRQAKEEAGATWDEAAWEEKWMAENEDWNKVLLIPVSITYDSTTSQTTTITGIQHDLQPGYTMLQGGPDGEALKLEVTYTRFNR